MEINESRVKRLLSGNKDYATYMGILDKIKDLFRTEKKSVAIERLYDFIHNHEQSHVEEGVENSDSFKEIIDAFDKLKSLSNENDRNLFRIEKNHYNGIDFHIGSVLIKSLDNCLPSYHLYNLNNNSEIKKSISEAVQKEIIPNEHNSSIRNLVIDMIRQGRNSAIDGKLLSNNTVSGKEETTKLINAFYLSLTRPQQIALVEVSSQSGYAHIFNALISIQNDFWKNFSPLGLSPATVMYHNSNSSDITVIQTVRRIPMNEKYQEAQSASTEVNGIEDMYPVIQMDVAFTISSDGKIDCPLFHVSNKITPQRYSLA
ncbi:hypothetical protein CBG25_08835 [Arsenophonus sp. ENCA]|nr:hypothetical protein CBG25_08835 [Arsenophonus sp. ENCA]